MSLNRPSWPHSAVEVLERINQELVGRLNADPQPQALWKAETGQLALSKPGGLRVVWSILGGAIQRGWQVQGPDQPARCVGIRKCRLVAEVRLEQDGRPGVSSVGITADTIQKAEEVLRALVIVWDHQRPADFDEEEQTEDWSSFTADPGQREVVCRYSVTVLLPVLGDPHELKNIEAIDAQGVVVQS